MDQKLKQRLTGAIVLVALAVIFVPIILEGPDDKWTPRSHSIPEQPQMDYRASMDLELPQPVEPAKEQPDSVITEALGLPPESTPATEPHTAELKSTPAVREVTKPPVSPPKKPVPAAKAPKPAKAAPAPPAKATKPVEAAVKGWFVQVGSFGQEMNASGLRDRLKSAGYDTRIQTVEIGKGHAYRVLVGPSASRLAAEQLAASLKSGQQLAGMVIEYP